MAQSNNMAATITKASGPILVERDGKALELKQGDSVYETDVIKTQGSAVELTFSDGAKAMLSPETTLAVKEFSFGNEDPSFVLNLVQGTMRSISGQVVEQNPDAFKVVTPKATVGIRGTDFVDSVNVDKSQTHFVIDLDLGHTLVLTTHDGQLLPITSSGQGAFIGEDESYELTQHNFSLEEMNEVLGSINALLNIDQESDLEEEKTKLEEEEEEKNDADNDADASTDSNQIQVLLDQSLLNSLEGFGLSALGELGSSDDDGPSFGSGSSSLEDLGTDDELLLTPQEEDDEDSEVAGESAGDDSLDTGTVPNIGLPLLTADGNATFFGDEQTISGGTHVLSSQRIELQNDMNTAGVVISGDAIDIGGGAHVTGGNDEIIGKNMDAGTVVGDAESVDSSTLIAGNDNIVFNNKTGGDSIYGDAKDVTNAVSTKFGNDSITINGDFTDSIIAGDVNSYAGQAGASVSYGNDTITINGDVTAPAAIYGDDVTGAQDTEGGQDRIVVNGTFDGTIEAGGGADTVIIDTIAGGRIDLGANDGTGDTLNIKNVAAGANVIIENFDASEDNLIINGVKQTVTGDGNYGGLDIDFTGGNSAPSISVSLAGLPTLADNSANTSVSGAIVITDPDPASGIENQSVVFTINNTDYVINTSVGAPPTTINGTYGRFVVNADGTYTYNLFTAADGPLYNNLGALTGTSPRSESFTVTTTDPGNASSTSNQVGITVLGFDNAPVITAHDDLAITEAGVGGASPNANIAGIPTANGTIQASDVDDGTILAYSFAPQNNVTLDGTNYNNDAFGTFTLNQDGTYSFQLNNNGVANSIAAGSTITLEYTITVSDGNQAGDQTETVEVVITGTNDKPTISTTSVTDVSGGNLSVSTTTGTVTGTATVGDIDVGDSVTVYLGSGIGNVGDTLDPIALGLTAAGADLALTYGTVSYDAATGEYTYVVDALAAAGIDKNNPGLDTFTIYVQDSNGAWVEQEITVTVAGTNDPPTITINNTTIDTIEGGVGRDAGTNAVDPANPNQAYAGSNLDVTHSFDVNDPDDAVAGLTVSVTKAEVAGGGNAADYGTLNINAVDAMSGDYEYTFGLADNAIVDALTEGEVITITYTISVDDGYDTGSETVTVTITGTNDLPDLAMVSSDDQVTDNGVDTTARGTWSVADVDSDGSIQTITATGSADSITRNASGVANGSITVEGRYGTLVVNADGTYTYTTGVTPAQVTALKGLGGDTVNATDSFTLRTTDDNGAFDEATFDITVNGANDAPVVTNATDTAEEAGVLGTTGADPNAAYAGTPIANGTLPEAADIDSATLTYTLDGAGVGLYGNLTFNGTTRAYEYTLDQTKAEGLAEGEVKTDVFTVKVSDGANTVDATITISVTGTNDLPILSIVDNDNSVTSGSDNTASGTWSVTDVDSDGAIQTITATGGAGSINRTAASTSGSITVEGIYGNLVVNANGTYTYTTGVTQTQIDNLSALGEVSVTDSFTLRTTDDNDSFGEATLDITVNGANDAPTITAVDELTVVEAGVIDDDNDPQTPAIVQAGTPTDTGTITATDVDSAQGSLTYILVNGVAHSDQAYNAYDLKLAGTYGALYLDSTTGQYIYVIDQTKSEGIALGDTVQDFFEVKASDGTNESTATTITVNIQGANDAPTISIGQPSVSLFVDDDNDAVQQSTTGQINFSDVDSATVTLYSFGNDGNEVAVNANGTTIEGAYGNLVINLDGSYTYTLGVTAQQKEYVEALPDGQQTAERFDIMARDDDNAFDSGTLEFTIEGTENKPSITVTPSTDNDVTAGSTSDIVASGTIDIDDPENVTQYTVTYSSDGDDDDQDEADEDNIISSSQGSNVIQNSFGTFTIKNGNAGKLEYEFVLDVTSSDVISINPGERRELKYIVSSEGVSYVIVITITGAALSGAISHNDNVQAGTSVDGLADQDNIILVTGNVEGGAVYANGASYDATTDAQAGDDAIRVGGNVNDINSKVIGDAVADNNNASGYLIAGKDNITISGSFEDGLIVGDSNVYDGASDAKAVGNDDKITVLGNMQNGSIYADNATDSASADGGDDIITIKGDFEGGTINGQGGDDIIIINGGDDPSNMTGDALIDAGSGDDTINLEVLNGNISQIAKVGVYGGDGADSIVIDTMNNGYVNAGDHGFDQDGREVANITKITTLNGGEVHGGEGYDEIHITTMTGGLVNPGDEDTYHGHNDVYITNLQNGTVANTSLGGWGNIIVENMTGGTIEAKAQTGGRHGSIDVNITNMSNGTLDMQHIGQTIPEERANFTIGVTTQDVNGTIVKGKGGLTSGTIILDQDSGTVSLKGTGDKVFDFNDNNAANQITDINILNSADDTTPTNYDVTFRDYNPYDTATSTGDIIQLYQEGVQWVGGYLHDRFTAAELDNFANDVDFSRTFTLGEASDTSNPTLDAPTVGSSYTITIYFGNDGNPNN